MKKMKKKKKATMPKKAGWCSLLWPFSPANDIRPESKEIIIFWLFKRIYNPE